MLQRSRDSGVSSPSIPIGWLSLLGHGSGRRGRGRRLSLLLLLLLLLLVLLLLLAQLLFLPRAGLPLERRGMGRRRLASVRVGALLVVRVRRLGRGVNIAMAAPTIRRWRGSGTRRRPLRRLLRGRAPRRRCRARCGSSWLVSIGVDVRGLRGTGGGATTAQQLQPRLDVRVTGVELRRPLVRIQGVVDLIVARFILHKAMLERPCVGSNFGGVLTRVPRSYQTSLIYGLSRMARE